MQWNDLNNKWTTFLEETINIFTVWTTPPDHISPLKKKNFSTVSKVSLTVVPLQTASACQGCTAGLLDAFPRKKPVPCKAFQLLASALKACHPRTK